MKIYKCLLFVFITLFFISCNNDEILENENSKMTTENISKSQLISELQNKEVIDFVKSNNYLTTESDFLKTKSLINEVSNNSIFQKIVKPNEYITYSLLLNSYSTEKPYYKYFIINKEANGEEKAGFVKYTPSTPTYNLDVDNFNGEIEIYTVENELFAKTIFSNGQPVSQNSEKVGNNVVFECMNAFYIVAHPCSHGGGHMPGQSCENGLVNDAYYEIRTTVICVDTVKSIVPPDNFGGTGNGGGGTTVLNLLNIPPVYEGEPSFNNQSYMFFQQVYNFLQANQAYNNLINNNYSNANMLNEWLVASIVDYFRNNGFTEQNQINVINAMNMFTTFLPFESNQYNFEEMLVNKHEVFKLLIENSEWLTNQTNETKQSIFNYLLQNHLDSESRDFTEWSINYLIQNPTIIFEQFKNWFLTPSEGKDFFYNQTYWENPNLSFQQQNLPTYNAFFNAYPKNADGTWMEGANNVYSYVGGAVQQARINYPNQTNNTCALKVSIALNGCGVVIPNIPGETLQGGGQFSNQYFFLNARSLNKWMRKTFGTTTNPNYMNIPASQITPNGANLPTLLAGVKGIYSLVCPVGSTWASGHADIINNALCAAGCHFPDAPIEYIDVWKLN